MAYKILVSPRALKEMEEAIDYYAALSENVPSKFITDINGIYLMLSHHPSFRIYYKNVRAIPMKFFPYLLFFSVDEKLKIVRILSCFHNSRNPKKRPF